MEKAKRKDPDNHYSSESEEYSEDAADIGTPGEGTIKMPKKSKYRMRAHINPLNRITYPVPISPNYVDWKLHYPLFYGGTKEENSLIFTNSMNFISC